MEKDTYYIVQLFKDHNFIIMNRTRALCNWLGYNESVLDRFHEINASEFKDHQTDDYYLQYDLSDIPNSPLSRFADIDKRRQYIITCLIQHQYSASRSEELANRFSEKECANQSLRYWMIKYIDHMCTTVPVSGENVPIYAYDSPSGDLEVSRSYTIDYINTTICESKKLNLEGKLFPNVESKWILYHGTDHDSAICIAENGIRLNHGMGYLDFSHLDGFYASPKYEEALYWACLKCRNQQSKPCVIGFSIDKSKYNGLELMLGDEANHDNANVWGNILRYNHCGRIKNNKRDGYYLLTKELRDTFYAVDYIEGPVGGNTYMTQVCIRSDKMVCEMERPENISRIVFLDSHGYEELVR